MPTCICVNSASIGGREQYTPWHKRSRYASWLRQASSVFQWDACLGTPSQSKYDSVYTASLDWTTRSLPSMWRRVDKVCGDLRLTLAHRSVRTDPYHALWQHVAEYSSSGHDMPYDHQAMSRYCFLTNSQNAVAIRYGRQLSKKCVTYAYLARDKKAPRMFRTSSPRWSIGGALVHVGESTSTRIDTSYYRTLCRTSLCDRDDVQSLRHTPRTQQRSHIDYIGSNERLLP